ncbi:unnamed protein product [Timema podura]|uniref:PX domain-containing protein n=1 Tax=Timema podura TaxID=61482 RepID=A0ABN7NH94_TIMPD|nr:unnamed protein product [Timema podura]
MSSVRGNDDDIEVGMNEAIEVVMNEALENLALDEEPDTRLGGGMLSFNEAAGAHSQASAHIKSWANVQRGNIVLSTGMSGDVLGSSATNGVVAAAPSLKFEVVYARTVDQENQKKHVAYTVMIRKDGAKPDPNPAVVERRYTDFLELYASLRRENLALMGNVAFPKKVILGNFGPSVISERSSCFEELLKHISADEKLRNSSGFNRFLQSHELDEARMWMNVKRYDQAAPLLENTFRLLNKLHTDRHPEVLFALCRLVACCNADPMATSAERFAELALRRYEAVSDADLLRFYVPLLQLCVHLWWRLGKEKRMLEERLEDLKRRGINVDGSPPLLDALVRDGKF